MRNKRKKNKISKKDYIQEIDIHCLCSDDAIYTVSKFIDKAVLYNFPEIKIVHGKGTGKLREVVREYLKSNQYISSYRLGMPFEGGDGVTIAKLK